MEEVYGFSGFFIPIDDIRAHGKDERLAIKSFDERKQPQLSGGLLAAMYLYQRLLTLGEQGFQAECTYGGHEPFYPPPADGKPAKSLAELRVDCEVINTRIGIYLTKWFFNRADQKLLGFEVRMNDANEDPCEVFLSDYHTADGRSLLFVGRNRDRERKK